MKQILKQSRGFQANEASDVIDHVLWQKRIKLRYSVSMFFFFYTSFKTSVSNVTSLVNMYQSGKGYKAIYKALGLQRTTVRAIIHKWRKLVTVVNLPRSGWPTKITPRAQRQLIQEVIKNPEQHLKKAGLLCPQLRSVFMIQQ